MSDAIGPGKIGSVLPVISRRDFIKGVIVGGAAVSSAGYLFRASTLLAQSGSVAGRLITINVNGQQRRADVMKQETLAWTVRHKLGLTGTKLSCDRSECGACTVMLDGVTTYSCSTLTQTARGRKITTIEGIAGPDGGLHKVQKAMIAELGPQCGFCTSGQVVAAVALLNRNPHPTIDEARRGMSGNLCKCGAYDHYLKAVMRASQEA